MRAEERTRLADRRLSSVRCTPAPLHPCVAARVDRPTVRLPDRPPSSAHLLGQMLAGVLPPAFPLRFPICWRLLAARQEWDLGTLGSEKGVMLYLLPFLG
jgi:hypothetical protein